MSSNHTNNMWHKLILQSQEDIYHWCSCNNSFCNLLPLRYFGQITAFLINNVSLQASIISLILWSQNTSQKIKGSYKYSHDIYIYLYNAAAHTQTQCKYQHLKIKPSNCDWTSDRLHTEQTLFLNLSYESLNCEVGKFYQLHDIIFCHVWSEKCVNKCTQLSWHLGYRLYTIYL